MLNLGKYNIVGIRVDATDYDAAVASIIYSDDRGLRCTSIVLDVHGLKTGALDKVHRFRLNTFDLVVPDGQPVRWALNILYGLKVRRRVYGPLLTSLVCQEGANREIPVFFYGSTYPILQTLCKRLAQKHSGLRIAGSEPSKYRKLSAQEQLSL